MMKSRTGHLWRWRTCIRLWLRGWRAGRHVLNKLNLPESFALFPAAEHVLDEFGDLYLGDESDHLHVIPQAGMEVVHQIKGMEESLGDALYPLGILEHQDREYVLINPAGHVFLLQGCVDDETANLVPAGFRFEHLIEWFLGARSFEKTRVAHLEAAGLNGRSWTLPRHDSAIEQ